MKAVVLIIKNDDLAEDVARMIAATLSLNGYHHDAPAVIDWPVQDTAAQAGKSLDGGNRD